MTCSCSAAPRHPTPRHPTPPPAPLHSIPCSTPITPAFALASPHTGCAARLPAAGPVQLGAGLAVPTGNGSRRPQPGASRAGRGAGARAAGVPCMLNKTRGRSQEQWYRCHVIVTDVREVQRPAPAAAARGRCAGGGGKRARVGRRGATRVACAVASARPWGCGGKGCDAGW